jgi:hypothetical protein
MTEFKKGDIIKDESSGLLFRITGYASYLVVGVPKDGVQQSTTIDWDEAAEATDEEEKSFIEAELDCLRHTLLETRAKSGAREATLDAAIANRVAKLRRMAKLQRVNSGSD